TVSLIRVADGTSIAELPGSAGAHFNGVSAMDPGKRWLAEGTADRIDVFDITTRTLIASIPYASAVRVRMMADGEHVIVEGPTKVMSVLDRSGKVTATFKAKLGTGTVLLAGDELLYATEVGENG